MTKLILKHKDDYDKACKRKFDPKKRRMVDTKPKEGFISKAIREYFSDLKTISSLDQKFRNAHEYARRCYQKYGNLDDLDDVISSGPSKKRCRAEGGGRKSHAPEFRDWLFEWFIGKVFGIFISL